MGKASRGKKEAQGRPSPSQPVPGDPSKKARIVAVVTVLVVCIAIIGAAIVFRPKPTPVEVVPADPSAASPAGAFGAEAEHPFGWPLAEQVADVPTLTIWEDFQCPGCRAFEDAMGPTVEKFSDEKIVNVVYRPTTFLDNNLGNDASLRATAAWGCAIDAGKGREYHDEVFANQPQREGEGYTDEQLRGFAGPAGIEGDALNTFIQCVDAGTYKAWAANSTNEFYQSNVPGTPYLLLNGQPVPNEIVGDEAALREQIAKVTDGGTVDSGTETPVSPVSPSAAP